MHSSDSDVEDKHLLILFSNFPCNDRVVTYEEAEMQLRSTFQLLNNEIIDFRFPVKLRMPSNDEFEIYATNWALRIIFDQPNCKFHHFVIPLKAIIKISKVDKASIKFHFSSGSHLTIEFPEIIGIRTAFINRINHLKKNVLQFEEKNWIPNPIWINRLLTRVTRYDLLSNVYCKSYPRYFLLPKDVPSYFIHESSHCRSRERFPILTYVYDSYENDTNNKVYLLRSSQPLNILTKSKSEYEHRYIASVCGEKGLAIIDCRPKKGAFGYELIGKGYESTSDFKKFIPNVSFHFLGIKHAYKTRDCYCSLMRNIFHGKKHPFKKWKKYMMHLLCKSCYVVNIMKSASKSVLVHCSDGWDRTSQICSLTQMMIDPYYRTLNGFIELIQKDWIDMGHMFCSRCGHVQCENFDLMSPIFAQFIDAVAQLMNKYQTEFEFNLKFLQLILSSAYSQLFGDFMGNNYNERLEMKRPTSIFLCFNDEKYGFADKIKNDRYQKSDQVLEFKKNDNYKFFNELMGTPAFFCEEVPLIKDDPPPFPDFDTSELETISKNNQEERENNEKLKQKCPKHLNDKSSSSDSDEAESDYVSIFEGEEEDSEEESEESEYSNEEDSKTDNDNDESSQKIKE